MISWEYWRRDLSTHILLLAVAVIWGSTWAVARFLSFGEGGQTSVGPATAAWIRYAFAVPVFFLWSASMRGRDGFRFFPPDRNSWKFSLWLGVLGTMGYQLLFMHGMRWTAAGDASLIIPINPVFTALLAVPMLGQKVTSRMATGLLVGIIGVAVVIGWSPNSEIPLEHRILGDSLIILAAMMWAATSNLTKIILKKDEGYSSLEIVIWYSFVGWLMLTPWMVMENIDSTIPDPNIVEWLSMAYLGIFSTVLSYAWFARGIDRIGPTAASSYVFLVPIFGIASGWLLLDEEVGWSMIVGFILIVFGVLEVHRENEKDSVLEKS